MERRPPFVIDYLLDGRPHALLLAAPASWAEAEAHLAAIRTSGTVVGSDAVEIDAGLLPLLADLLLARLAAQGRAAELMEAGAAILAAAASAARGQSEHAETLAVRLLEVAAA